MRWWLYKLAWPSYDCEQCVGQDWWQGCYCAYYGASAPNCGPEWWRVLMRRLYNFGWNNSLSAEQL